MLPPIARYLDYRLGPDADQPYAPDVLYWHVLAARLIFVLIFEVSYGQMKMTGPVTEQAADAAAGMKDNIACCRPVNISVGSFVQVTCHCFVSAL